MFYLVISLSGLRWFTSSARISACDGDNLALALSRTILPTLRRRSALSRTFLQHYVDVQRGSLWLQSHIGTFTTESIIQCKTFYPLKDKVAPLNTSRWFFSHYEFPPPSFRSIITSGFPTRFSHNIHFLHSRWFFLFKEFFHHPYHSYKWFPIKVYPRY